MKLKGLSSRTICFRLTAIVVVINVIAPVFIHFLCFSTGLNFAINIAKPHAVYIGKILEFPRKETLVDLRWLDRQALIYHPASNTKAYFFDLLNPTKMLILLHLYIVLLEVNICFAMDFSLSRRQSYCAA